MRKQYNLIVSAFIVAGLSCIEAGMKSQRACFAARQKSSKVISLCSASIVARALCVIAVKRVKSSVCSVARVVRFQRNDTEITVQFHCATRAR